MRWIVLLLVTASFSCFAEIGVDVGFKSVCNESEGLVILPYVGDIDSAKEDPSISIENSVVTCDLGEFSYKVDLRFWEATGHGACGGTRTQVVDLYINEKQIIYSEKFANYCVNSLDKLEIKHLTFGDPVAVCGKALFGDKSPYTDVNGCVSLDAKHLIKLTEPFKKSVMRAFLEFSLVREAQTNK